MKLLNLLVSVALSLSSSLAFSASTSTPDDISHGNESSDNTAARICPTTGSGTPCYPHSTSRDRNDNTRVPAADQASRILGTDQSTGSGTSQDDK